MFRCDFDVMESLDFVGVWDLNTPAVANTDTMFLTDEEINQELKRYK